jgi:DNA-binding GntR family transcriptional regulator
MLRHDTPMKTTAIEIQKHRAVPKQGSIETLAVRAYTMLEEMILTLDLEPGSIVTEKELIRRTGFGRTPLREATLQLGREKLVDVIPRKGILISDINIGHYLSLLEVRRVLDRLIAEEAARRATAEQRDELRRIAAAMEREAARKHLVEFMRLDRAFDALVEAAARNGFAVNAVKPMHAHCRRFWYLYRHNGDLPRAAGLHSRLMRAIASGNEKEAARASDTLMDYLEQFTKQTLEVL